MFRAFAIILVTLFIPAIYSGVIPITSRRQRGIAVNKCQYLFIPNCGKTVSPQRPLISNGHESLKGSAPWNVALYKKINNNYDLICGASLISPTLVITAAHCVEDNLAFMNGNKITDASMYKIAVGKYQRDISVIDDYFNTQIVDIHSIYMDPYYSGVDGHFSSDIAVIILKTYVIISKFVSPICIDWTMKYTISIGSVGKIVGWGRTETNKFGSSLLETSLPYIDSQTCLNMHSSSFRPYLRRDKFCAGHQKGAGVLDGDSGSGLMFQHDGLYYLTGVVSSRDPYSNTSVALFNKVESSLDWICDTFIKDSDLTRTSTIKSEKLISMKQETSTIENKELDNSMTETAPIDLSQLNKVFGESATIDYSKLFNAFKGNSTLSQFNNGFGETPTIDYSKFNKFFEENNSMGLFNKAIKENNSMDLFNKILEENGSLNQFNNGFGEIHTQNFGNPTNGTVTVHVYKETSIKNEKTIS